MKRLTFDPGPRAKAATLLTLVGVLGVLVGVVLDRALIGRALLAGPAPAGVESLEPGPRAPRRGGMTMPTGTMRPGHMGGLRFSHEMSEALELTAEQKAAIDSIMEENRLRVRALAREYNPRFRAIVEETRREVDAVLTDEQRERMREIQGSRRRMMREGMRRGGVSGGGAVGAGDVGGTAGAGGAASGGTSL